MAATAISDFREGHRDGSSRAVVVAIIGILAAVALPTPQSYTVKAKASDGILATNPCRTPLWDTYQTGNAAAPPRANGWGWASAAQTSEYLMQELLAAVNGGAIVNDTTDRLMWTADVDPMATQAAAHSAGASAYGAKIESDWTGGTTFGSTTHPLDHSHFIATGSQAAPMTWLGALAWVNDLNVTSDQGYRNQAGNAAAPPGANGWGCESATQTSEYRMQELPAAVNGGAMVDNTTDRLMWTADVNLMATQAAAYRAGASAYGAEIESDWTGGTTFGSTTHPLGHSDFIATGSRAGPMTWVGSPAWVNDLNLTSHQGHSNRMLPTVNPSDPNCSNELSQQYHGYNCTGSETGNLLSNDLGEPAGTSVLNQAGDTAQQVADLALFNDAQSDLDRPGTEVAPIPIDALLFDSSLGVQDAVDKYGAPDAVAVRAGDVAAFVPEPESLALVLIALGAAMMASRRRPR